jgi:diguanylate cyclase (GGDEF)-like protein
VGARKARVLGIRVVELLGRLPFWGGLATGAVLVAGLAAAQYTAGSEASFSIFYLVPVLYATWFLGRFWGFFFALASAATWGLVDLASGALYSTGWIFAWNSLVRFGFFMTSSHLLDSLHRAHRELRSLAYTDSLTGALNSRAFYMELQREIARQRRYGSRFSLCYIDLDHFKLVNDACGHAAGDELLRSVFSAMAGVLRATDTIARLGGDEFCLLMPQTGKDAATAALMKVRAAVSDVMRNAACEVRDMGATIGAVVFETSPESAESAVQAADRLMYEAKSLGRGRVRIALYRDARFIEQERGADDNTPP